MKWFDPVIQAPQVMLYWTRSGFKNVLLKQNVLLYFSNSMLAEKLNMTPDEAERWIVNLIRNARLDAKIDSKLVCVFCAVIFVNLVKRL